MAEAPRAAGRPGLLGWALLMFLGLTGGTTFLGVKLALTDLPPLWIAAIRTALGLMILLPFAIRAARQAAPGALADPRFRATALAMALLGLAAPFTLLPAGQQHLSTAAAGVIMATVPVLTLPIAWVLLPGERAGPRGLLGTAIGFAGIVALFGPDALAEIAAGRGGGFGQLLILGASLGYACAAVAARLCPPVPPVLYSAAALAFALPALLVTALLVEGPPPLPGPESLAGVFYLGTFNTALALLAITALARRAGAGFLSLFNYLVPVWAFAIGALVLGESLPANFALSLALVFGGLALGRSGR